MVALDTELPYWLGFSLIPGVGRVRFLQLLQHFGSLENAWTADTAELGRAGIDRSTRDSICRRRPGTNPEHELEKHLAHGITILRYTDDAYPARLAEIYDYPPLLFIRGEISETDTNCVAVVGTRQASVYGKQVAEELVTDLARAGVTVVSGLARGIDTAAHRAAIKAGGRTLAVMASGLDVIYPAENTELARNHIVKQGALVSEYPLGVRPRTEYFPRRNRIMSGLCLAVLVIEAGTSSGALITASMAAEQGRDVFAVPGNIFSPASQGTNALIQDGAKLIRHADDILEELHLQSSARQADLTELVPASETEASLLEALGAEPVHVDEICRSTRLPASTVSSHLAMMELKGLVKQAGAMQYVIAREARATYGVRIE